LLTNSRRYSLVLLGPFRLTDPAGHRLALSSKKGIAMLAMLATSQNGERTRAWLQSRLWGSRDPVQASASMRRELANLRKTLAGAFDELFHTDARRVRLRLERVELDLVRVLPDGWAPVESAAADTEFLEGVEIRGEEAFEAWLRSVRGSLAKSPRPQQIGQPAREPPRAEGAARERHSDPAVRIWLPAVKAYAEGNLEAASGCASEIAGLLASVRWLKVRAEDPGFGSHGRSSADFEPESDFIVERSIVGGEAELLVELKLMWADTREFVCVEALPASGEPAKAKPSVRLAARLVTRIEREQQARAMNEAPSEEDLRSLVWRSRWRLNRLTRADSAAAARHIERALTIAPASSEALIQKGIALGWELWARRAARNEMVELAAVARRIMLLDPDEARGYWMAGVAETWLGNYNAAIGWLRRAIEIDATLETAYAQLGSTLNLADRPAEGAEALEIAMSLSPNDMHLFFRHSELAISFMLRGCFDQAIEWADSALLLRPRYWFAEVIKIHALVEGKRLEAAQGLYRDLIQRQPDIGREYFNWGPFVGCSWTGRILASLEVASKVAEPGLISAAASQKEA
jgi:tetratricopeptide (TPR) repeat protein